MKLECQSLVVINHILKLHKHLYLVFLTFDSQAHQVRVDVTVPLVSLFIVSIFLLTLSVDRLTSWNN